MTIDTTYKLVTWIIMVTLGFVTMIINGFILYKEWKTRRSDQIRFTTQYLKIYSISSIICAVLLGLFSSVFCFNIFCYFSRQLTTQLLTLQAVFMGLYQLERLRYCFSKSQVHSNKGYPNYIFIIMYIIAICLTLYLFVYSWLTLTPSHCGINNQYHSDFQDSSLSSLYPFMTGIATMVYILWDWITLFLYILKVLSFRKYKTENKKIYNRILSILNRILILTITYEIAAIVQFIFFMMIAVGIIIDVSIVVSSLCISIVMNLSMYLMQEHNKYQYKQFLFMIYRFRLHYICCCCCKSIIDDEMSMYSDEKKLEIDINKQEKKEKKTYDSTICETQNESNTKIERVGIDAFELSVEITATKI